MKTNTYKKVVSAKGMKFGLVTSRFNEHITYSLRDAALKALQECKVSKEDITCIEVPGAFEIPFALQHLICMKKFDALIALGAVIRGETSHFEYIATEVSHGIMKLSLDNHIPIAFGVLTCNTLEQAIARSKPDHTNKGREAALAAVEMLHIFNQ